MTKSFKENVLLLLVTLTLAYVAYIERRVDSLDKSVAVLLSHQMDNKIASVSK
jgi:hypothetical protein